MKTKNAYKPDGKVLTKDSIKIYEEMKDSLRPIWEKYSKQGYKSDQLRLLSYDAVFGVSVWFELRIKE